MEIMDWINSILLWASVFLIPVPVKEFIRCHQKNRDLQIHFWFPNIPAQPKSHVGN